MPERCVILVGLMSKKIFIIRNAAKTDFGGGERFPVFLAIALRDAGWDTTVVSRSQKLLDFAHSNSVPTVRGWWWSRQNWSGRKILLTPVYFLWQIVLYFYYLRLLAKAKPDAVHIQSKDDFIAGTYAARALGIRIIWTDHADLKHIWQNLSVPYKNPVGKAVYRAARSADAITVVSRSEERLVKDLLPNSSLVKRKIQVVYNGVFDKAADYPAHKSKTKTRFIVASRLVYDKGIREVIEAFARLHQSNPATELFIMGDGPQGARLKSMPGADKATFLGHVDEPLAELAQAHIFVHPTYHEGFSVALVEASMMSLPVIATNVGGNGEIIHDHKTGLLVPAKDSDQLYTAMKFLLDNKKLQTQHGKAARRQYETSFEFTAIVAKHFIPLYGEQS